MSSDAFPSRLAATLALALIAVWPRAALSAETPPPPQVAVPASAPTPEASASAALTNDASEATPAEATPAEATPAEATPTDAAKAQAAPVDGIATADAATSDAASVEAAAEQAAVKALAAADAAMSVARPVPTPDPAAAIETVSKRKQQSPPAAAQPAAAEPAAAEPAAIPLIEDTNAPPPTPSAVEATPAAPSIPTANQPAPPASADPVLADPAVAASAVAAPAPRLPPTPRALGLPLPQPGEYIAAAGAGRLDIVAVAPAAPARRRDALQAPVALDFSLRSFGSNGHVCALEGRMVDGSARLPTGDGVPACIVSFVATQTGVQAIDDSRTCRYFCGSHASFEGIYLRPAPGCDDVGRAATRGLFQRLYAAGDLPRAQARLSGLLEHCDNTLHWLERAQIANDLARVHARLGRREDCLQTLAPMIRDAALDDASLGEGFLPEDAAAYLPQVRAARETLRRCRALPLADGTRAQDAPAPGIPDDLSADAPDPAHVGGGQR